MKKTAITSFIVTALILILSIPDEALTDTERIEPIRAYVYEDGVQRMDVIVDSFFYDPAHLVLRAGIPAEIRFRSVSTRSHDFVLSHPEAGLDVSLEIPGGTDVTAEFTPELPGKYSFHCSKRFLFFKSHRDRGMNGILEVIE